MNQTNLQFKTLLLLLALVTIAFIWILLPFYGAVFWAVILGIIFAPMQRRLQQRFSWNRNLTSLTTLMVCLVIAILPVIITSALLVQEGPRCIKTSKAASSTWPVISSSSRTSCRRTSSNCSIALAWATWKGYVKR